MSTPRVVRPFDSHGCLTSLHNCLLDSVMPAVSPNAWKILCLIVRQTNGWSRSDAGLSYSTIQAGTGIASRTTVSNAIKELVSLNLIERAREDEQSEMNYRLNLQAEITWIPQNLDSAPVQKMDRTPQSRKWTAPSPENGLPPSPENGLHVMKETSINYGKQEKSIGIGAAPSAGANVPDISSGKQSKPKRPKPEPDSRKDHWAIKTIRECTQRYPEKILWDDIIKATGEKDQSQKLTACIKVWLARGFNKNNSAGYINWFKNGIPEQRKPQLELNSGARREFVQ